MSRFKSLNEIKATFLIDSDDLEEIRKYLNEVRISNHPDKTNGLFDTDVSEKQYHLANDAIQYVDALKDAPHSLLVLEKVTDLLTTITRLLPNESQNRLENNLGLKISSAIENSKTRLIIPKISLTAVSAVVTFIFLFPNQIKDNPAISSRIDPASSNFFIMWLILLLYSALFWIIAYIAQERTKRMLSDLKVDSVQNNIFNEFVRENGMFTFEKDSLVNYIVYRKQQRSRLIFPFFNQPLISLEIAQNIAEIIIERALKNNVIKKISDNSLSEHFQINI